MAATSGKQLIVERILRDRGGIWQQIIGERDLLQLIRRMLVSSVASLAAYGLVLGASNGWLQALASTVKLPLLFLATLAICLPTLYLFNLVFGARLSVPQTFALIMVAVSVTAVLTFAFAPISLFFLITAQSYAFFKLLNIAILTLSAFVGLRFLVSGMRVINEHVLSETLLARRQPLPQPPAPDRNLVRELATVGAAPGVGGDQVGPGGDQVGPGGAVVLDDQRSANGGVVAGPSTAGPMRPAGPPTAGPVRPAGPPTAGPVWPAGPFPAAGGPTPVRPAGQTPVDERPASMMLLYIWILLFGFVGTQLAWTLRPFFGSPGEPFEIFRSIEGTFYADIFRTLGQLLGG